MQLRNLNIKYPYTVWDAFEINSAAFVRAGLDLLFSENFSGSFMLALQNGKSLLGTHSPSVVVKRIEYGSVMLAQTSPHSVWDHLFRQVQILNVLSFYLFRYNSSLVWLMLSSMHFHENRFLSVLCVQSDYLNPPPQSIIRVSNWSSCRAFELIIQRQKLQEHQLLSISKE